MATDENLSSKWSRMEQGLVGLPLTLKSRAKAGYNFSGSGRDPLHLKGNPRLANTEVKNAKGGRARLRKALPQREFRKCCLPRLVTALYKPFSVPCALLKATKSLGYNELQLLLQLAHKQAAAQVNHKT